MNELNYSVKYIKYCECLKIKEPRTEKILVSDPREDHVKPYAQLSREPMADPMSRQQAPCKTVYLIQRFSLAQYLKGSLIRRDV